MIQYQDFEMRFPGEGERVQIIAFDEGLGVLGTVCVRRNTAFVGDFSRLFVREDVRREGIGRRLIDRATELCRDAGHVAISCCVNPKNASALLFYERLGFRIAFQFADGDLLMTKPILQPIVSRPAGGAS